VSPTCGGCLLGAKETQKNVLATIDSSELSAFVVWAPKNGGREKHVNRVLDLVTDARARRYWEGDGSAVDAHAREFRRTAGRQFNGAELAERARHMLDQ